MGVAVTVARFEQEFFADKPSDKISGRRRSTGVRVAILLAGSFAGLTNISAAEHMTGEARPALADQTSPRQQSVAPAKTLPVQKAEAEMIDATLAYEERALVKEASVKQVLDPSTPDQELPQSAAAEIATREVPATPRRLQYAVSLSVRTVYDDNINISSTNRQGDLFTAIEPRLTIGFGDVLARQNNFIALSYAPSAFFFADHSEDNALQHAVRLEGQYRFPRLTLALAQDVQLLNGSGLGSSFGTGIIPTSSGAGQVNLDVAARTRVNVYNTSLTGNYSLTGKIFLTGGLSYSLTDYETLIGSSVTAANAYFNYTYSPKLNIGVGLSGGYDVVGSPSQDQVFEQVNARASYELTGKVSATATAGVEFRQYSGGGGSSFSPVFDATLLYQPFGATSISLSMSRQTYNSAVLAGQDYHSTQLTLGVQQRFFQRFFLGLTGGYTNSTYFSTSSGISSTREDNFYFLETSLDFNITRFWSAGLFYVYRASSSSLSIYSFYDNQFGSHTVFNF